MKLLKKLFFPKQDFNDDQWIDAYKYKTLLILLAFTTLAILFFLMLRLFEGNSMMVKINTFGVVVFGISFLLLRSNKKYYDVLSRLFILIGFIITTVNMNTAEHGSRAIWFATLLISVFYFRDKKEGLVWTLFFIIVSTVLGYINVQERSALLGHISYLTLDVNFILMSLLLSRYEKLKDRERDHLLNQTKILEQITVTDNLTGMYNRRYLYQIVDSVIQRQRRLQKNFIFVMMDIDEFKAYNDNYGHLAGDEALKKVAQAIMQTINRANDCAFRIGGEEFCIIMENLSAQEAYELVEQLRNSIIDLKIPHKMNQQTGYLTASFGIEALIPDANTTIDTIYHCADKKLYEAKESGRNKTVI